MDDTAEYVQQVFRKLRNNPTNQDLDFLIEAHARIGRIAAIAKGEAEAAVDERKYYEATTWREVKDKNPKYTAAQVEAEVYIANYGYRKVENTANENAEKLGNLLDSIREAINGIKYLGRNGGGDVRIGP
jgi:hypothetical protein